jgi:hypothetical protein
MKLGNRKLSVSILLIAALIVGLAVYIYSEHASLESSASAETNQELTLTRPTFSADVAASSSFLDQEAGMAIWLNATAYAPIDVNAARSALTNVEINTTDFVVGSIGSQVYGSSDLYPHCFIHTNGWIVVYYLNPTSQNKAWIGKIINWNDISHIDYPVTDNFLREGLDYIASKIPPNIPTTSANYYHFHYPEATKLMFAIKHGNPSSFDIKIPTGTIVYEYSWSSWVAQYASMTIKIDNATPPAITAGWNTNYGGSEISSTNLPSDIPHTIDISSSSNTPYFCLILLYS